MAYNSLKARTMTKDTTQRSVHIRVVQKTARERKELMEVNRGKQRGFGSTLSRFPKGSTRNMVGATNESGDAGKYLQWNGSKKPECGGLGFSFNDSGTRRHTSQLGPSSRAPRKGFFDSDVDGETYSYHDHHTMDNAKTWTGTNPNQYAHKGRSIMREERFKDKPGGPMPVVGTYNANGPEAPNLYERKGRKVPFNTVAARAVLTETKTEPSPSMTQYNLP